MLKLKKWLSRIWQRLMLWLGRYDRYGQLPEAFQPQRVIFVCKGNVCRSVYAAYYFQKVQRDAALNNSDAALNNIDAAVNNIGAAVNNIEIVSCGLETDGNTPANATGITVAATRQVDLSNHSSVKAQSMTFGPNDLIIVMEPYMVDWINRIGAQRAGARTLILGMLGEPRLPSIPDPFGQSEAVFNQVFDTIEQKIHVLRSRRL